MCPKHRTSEQLAGRTLLTRIPPLPRRGLEPAQRGDLRQPGRQRVQPGDLDDAIQEMIDVKKPVIFDCRVANLANCFPMIPSGKAHNEMLLPDEANDEAVANAISAEGKSLV
mgnify:CR=1 FL=1